MKTLILSDIHANLPAFQAVLDDAGSWDQVWFLGDLPNFGPCPAECVDLLRSLNSINIMGNHDFYIAGGWEKKRNFFDAWSRAQLSEDQLRFLRTFDETLVLGDTLLIHGAYEVDYKILPGIDPAQAENAFRNQLTPAIKQVFFGHYHYQVDLTHNGVEYHCIRPVGHHRDRDTRAGYSLLTDGVLTHHRVEYDVEETLFYGKRITGWPDSFRKMWIELLTNAYQEDIMKDEIAAMKSFASPGASS